MSFQEANRKDIRIKMALAGSAGSGKTLGALLIAKGLVSDVSNIGVVQTESGRAQCYIDQIGKFKVMELAPPFEPEKFVKAIEEAEKLGIRVLILDSISDEWSGLGGSLDIHQQVSDVVKNSFTAWKKVTPRHENLFNKILASPVHIICTVKKKSDYVIETNEKGKQVPRRVGVKDVQREGTEFRWMIQLDVDQQDNLARCSKDNTGLFQGKEPFKITEDTGRMIREWCLKNA